MGGEGSRATRVHEAKRNPNPNQAEGLLARPSLCG